MLIASSMIGTYLLIGLLFLIVTYMIHEKHPYRFGEDGQYDEIKPRDIIWIQILWPYIFLRCLKCVVFWWVMMTIGGIKNLVISFWRNEWVKD